jgi:hypothetical protein
MAQAVSCWPITMEDKVQSQVSSCEICGAKNGIVTFVLISTLLAFLCQCHSVNTPFHSFMWASPEANDKVHNSHTLPSPPRVLILYHPPPTDYMIILWRVQVMNLPPHVGASDLLLLPPPHSNVFLQILFLNAYCMSIP